MTGGPQPIIAQTREVIRVEPDQVLEFVMDINRYAQIDAKIRPIIWACREGNLTEFSCRSKVGGVPGPKVVQQLRLTPGRRIDIAFSPPPRNRLARSMTDFSASFACEPVEGGTLVVRTLRFVVKSPASWVLGPILRRRLQDEVREELRLAKEHLEALE